MCWSKVVSLWEYYISGRISPFHESGVHYLLGNAIDRGDLHQIRRLIEDRFVNVNFKYRSGQTPLSKAARLPGDNNGEIIRYLIDKGANVNTTPKVPLIEACRVRNVEAARILLEHDADVDYELNPQGMTALLMLTHYSGNGDVVTDLVLLLLQYGANVNVTVETSYDTSHSPLTNVCRNACADKALPVVERLLKMGANVNWKDLRQDTALHFAAARGSVDIVRLLIAHGANVDATNSDGDAPIHRLARAFGGIFRHEMSDDKGVGVLRVLLDAKANVLLRNKAMQTVLLCHGQVLASKVEFVQMVVDFVRVSHSPTEFGAFLTSVDKCGSTLLLSFFLSGRVAQVLVEQPRQDGQLPHICAKMLLQKDNAYGHTIMQWAAKGTCSPLWRARACAKYISSFACLPLAAASGEATTTGRQVEGAVKLNTLLNAFQLDIAQETLDLVQETTGLRDLVAYQILGCLSTLDVMRR